MIKEELKTREAILQFIDKKRNELIYLGIQTGLSSKETIKCSQELDNILNKYREMCLPD